MAKGKERKLDWAALAEMKRPELKALIDEHDLGIWGAKSMDKDELRQRIADELGIEIKDKKLRADSLNHMDRYELKDLINNLDLQVVVSRSMDADDLRAAIAEELGLELEATEDDEDESYEDPAYGDKLDPETAATKLDALWDEMGANFLMTKKQLAKFCGRDYRGAFKDALDDSLEYHRMLISATEQGFAVIYLDDMKNLLEVDQSTMEQVFA